MTLFTFFLYILLFTTVCKILLQILSNIEEKLLKDIKRNKLRYGLIISRKDLASIKSGIKIKNMFLYQFISGNEFFKALIPYRLIYDDISARDLDEFLHWCSRFLSELGYSNINYTTVIGNKYTNFVCEKNNSKVYVQCLLENQDTDITSKEEDIWPKVGRPVIQAFVGAMTQNKIYNGILITTGDFSKEALEYSKTLPSPYSVTLIDGYKITETVRKLREKVAY